jgi:isocitrate dehydrogenase
VSDERIVPFIEGDGVGAELFAAARPAIDAAVAAAYRGHRALRWHEILAGQKAMDQRGTWLPAETLDAIRAHRVALKGPLTNRVGPGSPPPINVTLRVGLDLYACVRPIRPVPGAPTPVRHPEKIDLVVFRESTEDTYTGVEWPSGSPGARALLETVERLLPGAVPADAGVGVKFMSPRAVKRLVRAAIRHALEHRRPSVTLVHKGAVMKQTEGAFKTWGYEVARDEFPDTVVTQADVDARFGGHAPDGKVVLRDLLADTVFQQVLLKPDAFSVLAAPNLNGDYLSDALAAQIGGIGLAPGANYGDDLAVFEAAHGSAPQYAGQGRVNPTALMLSGALLLEHVGWPEAAAALRLGIGATITAGTVTEDLARGLPGTRAVSTAQFGARVVAQIERTR